MKYHSKWLITLLLCLTTVSLSAQDCCEETCNTTCGKIDLGIAYVHIDVLQCGKTEHTMEMPALKFDTNYRIWSGFVIKPNILYARGRHDDLAATGSLGLGFCCPFKQRFCITPVVGYNWGYLKSQYTKKFMIPINAEGFLIPYHLQIHEKFRSNGPFVGLEASWTFCPCWRIVGYFQYIWSNTRTELDGILKDTLVDKSSSKGPSYSAMIEHDFNDQWSMNVGAAYNISLTKEKHGVRAAGVKIGIAYWF